jgi:hypothetical protein
LKTLFIKVLVNGKSHAAPHAGNRAKGSGSGPQMGNFPQKFQGMSFFLQGISQRCQILRLCLTIFRRGFADYQQRLRGNFHRLTGSGRGYQLPANGNRRTGTEDGKGGLDLGGTSAPVKSTLNTGKTGTVTDLDKNQIFHFPPGFDPAANIKRLGIGCLRKDFLDKLVQHTDSIA